MAFSWKTLHILAIFTLLLTVIVQYSQARQSHCQKKCGNVTIPYPFGIGEKCALNDDFAIFCNESNPDSPIPYLPGSHGEDGFNVMDISIVNGTLRTHTYAASDCYTIKGKETYDSLAQLGKFFFYSATRNKFIAIGCDTSATVTWYTHGKNYTSGCVSLCFDDSNIMNNSCSGIGCCQASIPPQLSDFEIDLSSYYNHTYVKKFNPCSYAFIAEVDYFNFSTASLGQQNTPSLVPTVLDWTIGNRRCAAVKKTTHYACKEHSHCQDYKFGPGYQCFCDPGYTGNPYLEGGCVDVDECEKKLDDCTHRCHNTKGSYTCSCPRWFHGDDKRNGKGCILDPYRTMIVTGILLVILASASCALHGYRRKQILKKRKEKFFKQNGGTILVDRLSKGETSINKIRIFKAEEPEAATDNFSESRICGRGGYGTVYKGFFSDGTVAAIKKCRAVDPRQTVQFINEIAVVSQIKHQNVVRLLGCCFETPEPLLVYEYITNGTLSDHIHDSSNSKMSWHARLKVLAETAGVLAYLHSEHSPPIIHRDIKPANILLDENYTAKVSDFGCSKLTPKSEIEICTMVQGTLGYLDPEYLQTGQLTEKSDVYSFGVVLIGLLTGLRPISFERAEEDWSLVNYFLSYTNEDRTLEILDKGIISEDNIKEMIEVSKIAKACVVVKGEERPGMKEVAAKLEGLLMTTNHKWADKEEAECLLGEVSDDHFGRNMQMAGYSDTGQNFLALDMDSGR